jgi:dTDP-4-amino-4,6-dideoxygalactose transaminase
MMEALSAAQIGSEIARYVEAMMAMPDAFRGQQLRGNGPVAEFESLLALQTGFPFCLTTSSATSALLAVILAAELRGKRIAVERGAWEGSLGALEFVGAEVSEVDSLLTAPLGEVSAILATDQPGKRHDATAVRFVCDQKGILYIEDTAWLPGVTAPAGSYSMSDIQVISFGPGKPLCLGEGGAMLCRSEAIYGRAVALSQHPERAMTEGVERFMRPLMNARIHPLAALLGALLLRHGADATDIYAARRSESGSP